MSKHEAARAIIESLRDEYEWEDAVIVDALNLAIKALTEIAHKRASSLKYRQNRTASGCCVACGKKLPDGYTHSRCPVCFEKRKSNEREKRENGKA